MTRFRILVAAAAAVAVALLATSAIAASRVAFSATYTGKAAAKVAGQTVAISALGSSKAGVLGPSKISGRGTGDASNPPCVPFSGPGTIAGTKGKLAFTVLRTSRGCAQEDQQHVNVSGTLKVLHGTGKFLKAHGILKFKGLYNRGTGAFTIRVTGALVL